MKTKHVPYKSLSYGCLCSQHNLDLFYRKINKTESCWNWIGSVGSNGSPKYVIYLKRENNINYFTDISCKIYSYIIQTKNINVNGRTIIQMCDNIFCCNPNHFQIHNLTNTREHKFFEDMVARCLNPNHPWYYRYGGRGITIDPKYNPNNYKLKGVAFLKLYNDCIQKGIFPIPDKLSIDRINNDDGYYLYNLRLADSVTQSLNRYNNGIYKQY